MYAQSNEKNAPNVLSGSPGNITVSLSASLLLKIKNIFINKNVNQNR